MEKYEDKIYSLGEAVTGQTQAMSQAVQKTLENNGGVGIMTGSYDQNLSILSVNNNIPKEIRECVQNWIKIYSRDCLLYHYRSGTDSC